jgi:hypothetical protein
VVVLVAAAAKLVELFLVALEQRIKDLLAAMETQLAETLVQVAAEQAVQVLILHQVLSVLVVVD